MEGTHAGGCRVGGWTCVPGPTGRRVTQAAQPGLPSDMGAATSLLLSRAGVAVCTPSEQTAGRPSAGQWLWILTEASSQGRTPASKEGKSYLLVERVIFARDFDFRDIT